METKKIDFGKIAISQEGSLSLALFAFMKFHEIYQVEKAAGKSIVDMKITYNTKVQVSELGFRQFLQTISSLDFDIAALSLEEKDTINDIVMYLLTPIDGGAEPIVTGGTTTLQGLIDQTVY